MRRSIRRPSHTEGWAELSITPFASVAGEAIVPVALKFRRVRCSLPIASAFAENIILPSPGKYEIGRLP